jgi:hypothetical protein
MEQLRVRVRLGDNEIETSYPIETTGGGCSMNQLINPECATVPGTVVELVKRYVYELSKKI